MWPVLSGLISGGASLLGGMFSSQTSAQNTEAQIAASEQQQSTQNQFTEQMSNTAYQRASQDMSKAGLNPAMMFGSGSAASTPAGSSIQAPMPQNRSPLAGLGEAVNKGLDSAVTAKTYDKMSEEIASLKAQQIKTAAETDTERAKPAEIAARTGLAGAETTNVSQDTTAKKLDRARQEWEAIKYIDLSNIPDAARKAGNVGSWGAQKISDVVAPIASTASKVVGLDVLRKAFANRNSATSFRRGMDTERNFPSGGSLGGRYDGE